MQYEKGVTSVIFSISQNRSIWQCKKFIKGTEHDAIFAGV